MEEDLPILKQVFNLCLWLQINTKLNASFCFIGDSDILEIEIHAGEKSILNFKLDAFTKKSEERINIELKLIVAQLIELKNDEHFK